LLPLAENLLVIIVESLKDVVVILAEFFDFVSKLLVALENFVELSSDNVADSAGEQSFEN
jgi:hypothetical protein